MDGSPLRVVGAGPRVSFVHKVDLAYELATYDEIGGVLSLCNICLALFMARIDMTPFSCLSLKCWMFVAYYPLFVGFAFS